MTKTKPAIQPFTVLVTRGGTVYSFPVRGTHDMLYRLCERIDAGQGRWGQEYGPVDRWTGSGYAVPADNAPTQYDERDGSND